jgi:hypothetical protein
VLRRIFGSKKVEMMRWWSKLHNEDLHNTYSSPNIIRLKSTRKSSAGQAAHQGAGGIHAYRILVGKQEERDHKEDLDIFKMV